MPDRGMALIFLAVVMSAAALSLAVIPWLAPSDPGGDGEGEDPEDRGYVRTLIDYDMEYKNTLHGEAYILTFEAPADGYAVISHGSQGWFEEHRMFHKGQNSIAVERYSSVGRPSVVFYTEADRYGPAQEMPRLQRHGQDRLCRTWLRARRVSSMRKAHGGASRGRLQGRMEQEEGRCLNTNRPASFRSCLRITWRSRASPLVWRMNFTPTSSARSIQTSRMRSTPS